MADAAGLRRARLLRAYRLLVLVGIVLVAHAHVTALRSADERPLTLREVRTFLPAAEELRPVGDASADRRVLDVQGHEIGHALRTSPRADAIVGYAGPSDTLIVLAPDGRVLGAELRRSLDTPGHVRDVVADARFWDALAGSTREELARGDFEVDAVTGATRTSRCVLDGIALRLGPSEVEAPGFALTRHDWLVAVLAIGMCVVTLGRGNWRRHARVALRVVVLVYLGLQSGDLLALSLAGGWTSAGSPWRAAPGMCALALAALVLPWSSGHDSYCSHACPHGALQEWITQRTPKRWRWRLPKVVEAALERVPAALLVVGVLATALALPLDLAGLEPFDAYVVSGAGAASVALFFGSLALAPFVPMGYCRFGCPSGALLRWMRTDSRGRFHEGDAAAGVLLLLTLALTRWHAPLWSWLGSLA